MTPKDALARWIAPAGQAIRLAALAQGVGALAAVAVAFGLAHAVTALIDGSSPWPGALAAGLGGLVRAGAVWAQEAASWRAGDAIVAAARADILERAEADGPRVWSGEGRGARVAQLVDRTGELFGHAARWRPGVLGAAVAPLIVWIAVATQSWVAAVVLAIAVPLAPLFIVLLASKTGEAARAQQAELDALSAAFHDRSAHVGVIKAFNAVGRETDRLALAADGLRQRTMKILRLAFLTAGVLEFFTALSIAMVAVYVGFKLLGVFPFATGETLTLREGIAALMLAPEFFGPIRRLAALHHDRQNATAAADTLAAWLSETRPERRRAPKLLTPPRIQFKHVTLAYGRDGAVRDVRFTAPAGKITALLGPSGSGKTSVLAALMAGVDRRAGDVRVDAIALAPDESLHESVAYLAQTPWVFAGSVRDNIALAAPDAPEETIRNAARAAGVLAFAGGQTGLDRRVGRGGEGLSGGERQRVALARALARDARVLLLDEPTAHLDEDAEAAFLEALHRVAKGRTTLIATHRPAVAAAADHVVRLDADRDEGAAA